ncbi:type 11 methyltransferase [endosymbiont of Acanthamoeba sp. UWC8]|uniref:class I SAM-dependent methyltransferase n=1 Tax=endosymbiont of Acanthamoeba sp. UWC8 TaxID=86106 RepID=UPI0004D19EEB|nr:methyltransferase domain-containing protein [endosymbiont of Acanthamoeba sp. UWC8]AIF81459.1 type 11 methyltransferase [endosymbiont of Acanthamoeba sp. UWC8]
MIKSKDITRSQTPSDADPYCPENISLFETIYGKNLISLGGFPAIDNMFSGLNIRGLKALDLGFGLGGAAFYLVENYLMTVFGVEVYPWMVRYAHNHMPQNLAHSLEFNVYNDKGELPYKPKSFDLVYSKGVLNHVADKDTLFRQVNAVLKPAGLFVIADWIFPQAITDSSVPLVCETKKSYEQVLKNTGFSEIEFRDDSKIFLGYAKALLKNLTEHREFIEQTYNKELFFLIRVQHEELIEKINNKQKYATRIVAKKD